MELKLIVGLGNPGSVYAGSRHNIGFAVVKALARDCRIGLKKDKDTLSLRGKGRAEGQEVMLALPLTFMNLSGKAVSSLLKKYHIAIDNLLVVGDDLDLDFGRMRIRPSGSSGGQRGIKSIIDSLNSQNFCRLRIGIGRPSRHMDAADYVLTPFAKQENKQMKQIVQRAVDCSKLWAVKGITEAMNMFNK